MRRTKKLISYILVAVMILTAVPMTAYAKASSSANKTEANIILFGYFSNDTKDAADTYFETNKDKLLRIFDGANGRSFKNYINTISYGKLSIENIIPQYDGTKINAAPLSITETQAQTNDYDSEIIDSLIKSMPSIADKTVDYDGDGIADNVMIVLKTEDTYDVESGASLVAHRGQYVGASKINSKGVYNYNIFGTDRVLFEESGLVAHEFLHTLGYPDLYRNSGDDNPVYTWSIMGGVTRYPQYPLAYERMYFSNWIDIDEVTESTSLTLDSQDNANGNGAYIIKSPLNDHEIFVVEYRVKAARDYTNTDSLDYPIGGTGLIVYRVDLTVEGLSNIKGGTGIYVFRPQDGQPGYSTYEKTSVNNAYLPYSGTDGKRKSIGSADMSMNLSDGALTFSDGSNSGIEINNCTLSADGSQVSCDVTIPQKDDYDLWENLNYKNSASDDIKAVGIESVDDSLYSVTFDDGKIVSRKYNGGVWSDFAASIPDQNVQNIKLEHLGNYLYLAYYDMDDNWNENIKLYKYDLSAGGNWTLIESISNAAAGVDLDVINNEVYITYLTYAPSGWENDVNVAKLSGDNLESLGVCATAMVGQPKIVNFNNELYIAYRNANGNIINLQKYNGFDFDKVSDDSLKASYYDIIADNNKLYVALGGSALKMASYDGESWSTGAASEIHCGEPSLAVIENNLFVLASPQSDTGNLKMYHFENDTYTQEGENIDASASEITTKTIGKDIYLSYILFSNSNIVIKSKTAKQITPAPDKEVDKSALDAAIQRGNIQLSGDYSAETLASLSALITQYNPLLTEDTATQKQVDSATREIIEAMYNLKSILNLDLSSPNGTYSVNYDNTTSNNESYSIVSGTKVKLSATANNGYVFASWYDMVSKRVMSTNSEYTFTISSNKKLKAVFNKTQSSTLTFANSSGYIQSMVTKTTDEWSGIQNIENMLPAVPYKYGYSNGKWVYDNAAVLAKLKAGENVAINPEYTLDDDSLPIPREATDVPVLDLYYKFDSKNSVGSFVMAAGFPENFKIESIGIAFYFKDATTFNPADNFELLLNNKMLVSNFNIEEKEDTYIVNIKNMKTKDNWAGRGYVTYYDELGELKTVYSNQINLINCLEVN